MKIGLLISGSLGMAVLRHLFSEKNIVFVMTDKNSSEIISFCQDNNLEVFLGNPRNGKCKAFINNKDIDVLISVNYLFLIEKDLISLPKRLAFNIHGSLLPSYRGRTPHVWAIINNEEITGVTAHVIDEGCDTGDILEQHSFSISESDTGGSILSKFESIYTSLVEKVLYALESGTLSPRKQEHSRASFFGKRTPEDGRINWDWQKLRIRNWVRAQAFPYPGAFTFLEDQKLIIDKISIVDYSYSYQMANGLILCAEPLLVKTPNGVMQIDKIRTENINPNKGQILK